MIRPLQVAGLSFAALCIPAIAGAAVVKGVAHSPPAEFQAQPLGHTVTQVAAPAKRPSKKDVAVFLRVKESLPISDPAAPGSIAISGLRFHPSIATCAVDGKVEVTNRDTAPVTLVIANGAPVRLASGESMRWDCTAGASAEELRPMRLVEWPHARASIFVGTVGVASQPDAEGRFQLDAPKGTYELLVVTHEGVLIRKDVEIDRTDLDIGALGAAPVAAPVEVKPSAPSKPAKPRAPSAPRPPADAKPDVEPPTPPTPAAEPEESDTD